MGVAVCMIEGRRGGRGESGERKKETHSTTEGRGSREEGREVGGGEQSMWCEVGVCMRGHGDSIRYFQVEGVHNLQMLESNPWHVGFPEGTVREPGTTHQ